MVVQLCFAKEVTKLQFLFTFKKIFEMLIFKVTEAELKNKINQFATKYGFSFAEVVSEIKNNTQKRDYSKRDIDINDTNTKLKYFAVWIDLMQKRGFLEVPDDLIFSINNSDYVFENSVLLYGAKFYYVSKIDYSSETITCFVYSVHPTNDNEILKTESTISFVTAQNFKKLHDIAVSQFRSDIWIKYIEQEKKKAIEAKTSEVYLENINKRYRIVGNKAYLFSGYPNNRYFVVSMKQYLDDVDKNNGVVKNENIQTNIADNKNTFIGYKNTKNIYATFYDMNKMYATSTKEVLLSFKNPLIITDEKVQNYDVVLEYLFFKWFPEIADFQNNLAESQGIEVEDLINKLVCEEAIKKGYDAIIMQNSLIVDLTTNKSTKTKSTYKYIAISKSKSAKFDTNSYVLCLEYGDKLIKGIKLTYGFLFQGTKIGTKRGWFISLLSMDKSDFEKYYEYSEGEITV